MRALQLTQGTNSKTKSFSELQVGRILNANRRIGGLMKLGREETGMSVDNFAEKFGVSSYEVERWETGFGTLKASLFADIAPHFSEGVQWKFQLLINDIQAESRTLRKLHKNSRELVDNFDALGAVRSYAA